MKLPFIILLNSFLLIWLTQNNKDKSGS